MDKNLRVKEKKKLTRNEKFKLALYILGVTALGLLALNGMLSLMFKSQILTDPCGFCAKQNPHLAPCFNEQSTVRINPYVREINLSNVSWGT